MPRHVAHFEEEPVRDQLATRTAHLLLSLHDAHADLVLAGARGGEEALPLGEHGVG